jgi:hypothetical protein
MDGTSSVQQIPYNDPDLSEPDSLFTEPNCRRVIAGCRRYLKKESMTLQE